LIFTRGIPTFSNENENEASGIFVVFPRIFSLCIGPINISRGPKSLEKIVEEGWHGGNKSICFAI